MDGVVTQTATLHFDAWKIILDEYVTNLDKKNRLFSEDEYWSYLDGMPRKEGLSNFLKERKIGYHQDILEQLCDKKNELLHRMLFNQSVKYFSDTIQFIEFLLAHNYQIALISSSKNCIPILESAQIKHLFPIYVDGIISEELNLRGKPEPDIFLEAAKRLKLLPRECVIIEDALAGVKAGKKGGFGGVIALDRRNKLHHQFRQLGADYILPNLASAQNLFYFPTSRTAPLKTGTQALKSILRLSKLNYQFVIFLDYDGTLTPIRERPSEAVLSNSMHYCLNHLSRHYPTVIMSGRELKNLQKLINIASLFYSGNHGFEFEGPQYSYEIGQGFKEEIKEVYDSLYQCLFSIPDCFIENKTFSLSVHYRLVEKKYRHLIEKEIERIMVEHPHLKKHLGKKVYEIRPNINWNKGIASTSILNRFKAKNHKLIPIYIGDDVSDEDAFEAFKATGITIKVAEKLHHTKAHYYLDSPLEVQNFLTQLTFFKECRI